LRNNEYDIKAINKLLPRKMETQVNSHDQKTKWATFTYNGKEVRKVTNLFRDNKYKSGIPYAEHDTRYIKTTPTNRQV
jgi:hypothetical protein